jgi:hypothetical protein
MADPATIDARTLIATRTEDRAAAYRLRPPDWLGTCTPTQLAVPYLANWGFPAKFYRKPSTVEGRIVGLAGSPGVVEGPAHVVLTTDQFDQVRKGDIVVCQMTNPAWVALFTKMAALVTDAGGHRHILCDQDDQKRRSHPGQRHNRGGRHPSDERRTRGGRRRRPARRQIRAARVSMDQVGRVL